MWEFLSCVRRRRFVAVAVVVVAVVVRGVSCIRAENVVSIFPTFVSIGPRRRKALEKSFPAGLSSDCDRALRWIPEIAGRERVAVTQKMMECDDCRC